MKLIEMAHKISNGYNQNEVIFVSKNPKKLNFFEKFFNYLVKLFFTVTIVVFKFEIFQIKSSECRI